MTRKLWVCVGTSGSLAVGVYVDTERTIAMREERRRNPAPNVVVFFVDNVQADHAGAYGYTGHPSTPNFDAHLPQWFAVYDGS